MIVDNDTAVASNYFTRKWSVLANKGSTYSMPAPSIKRIHEACIFLYGSCLDAPINGDLFNDVCLSFRFGFPFERVFFPLLLFALTTEKDNNVKDSLGLGVRGVRRLQTSMQTSVPAGSRAKARKMQSDVAGSCGMR